jgi:diguanylate cyclase (GGDEF)-like protein
MGTEPWLGLPAPTRACSLLRRVQRLPAGPVSIAALTSILVLAAAAANAPAGLDLHLLHVVPVALATAAAGLERGITLGLFATAVWMAADLLSGAALGAVAVAGAVLRLLGLLFIVVLVDTTMRQLRSAARLSWTDELTGLPNRRAFDARAELELARMRRSGTPTTVAFLDVDGFKGVNDDHGHAAGDEVLRRIGRTLRSRVRATDLAARLGGDEFVLLLTDTAADSAVPLLRDLQQAITSRAALGAPVTISVGAVTFHTPPASVMALLQAPDGLMYEVKRNGRSALRHAEHGTPAADHV